MEREVLEFDVQFIGAGPAGLAGAIHLTQLIEKHKEQPRFFEHRYTALSQVAFHMMAESLNEQNIPLLVIDGPTHPLIRKFYDPRLDSIYDDFWRGAAATHGFTYLPGSELPTFEDADFNDFTHLNAAARMRLTAFIADYLQAHGKPLGLGSK